MIKMGLEQGTPRSASLYLTYWDTEAYVTEACLSVPDCCLIKCTLTQFFITKSNRLKFFYINCPFCKVSCPLNDVKFKN